MRKLGILAIVLSALWSGSAQQLRAQVNMQYSGQYRGQFNGQYSGRYYGGNATDPVIPPYARNKYDNPLGFPVNSGACGELYYPPPGTDNVVHDSQGRRCY